MFKDTVAVITGGASGIGRALAETLARQGASVAIADISQDRAQETAAAIGGAARAYGCDVTDLASVEALAAAVLRDFGKVNFAFSNAGVFVLGPLHEVSPADFAWLFDVNVKGGYNVVHAFSPALLAEGGKGQPARFVFTGSENSVGLPFLGIMSAYTATKHAVLAMAEGLRRDLEGTGVGASVFCPGPVATNLWNAASTRGDSYGGSVQLDPVVAEMSKEAFGKFVDPAVTAAICLEGIANDECIIITDPCIRPYAEKRHADVAAALDRVDARFGAMAK